MRQAARQASRLWKLPLMQWKVEQNRLGGVEAGLEAMEIGTDAMESGAQTLGWLGGGKPQGRPAMESGAKQTLG